MSTASPITEDEESSQEMSPADMFFLLSDDQLATSRVIQEPLKYILFALAVPLAVCTIIVFSRKSMRTASGTYVIALNVGQLAYVTLHIMKDIWVKATVNPFLGSPAYCLFYYYMAICTGLYLGKRGSYIILCLATVERLYAVIRPLHIKNFFLSKRPGLCVAVTYAVVAITHIPNFLAIEIIMIKSSSGQDICRTTFTALYNANTEALLTCHLFLKIIYDYAAIFVQLIINILIAVALRRHNMAIKHVTSSVDDAKRRQERQLTITLLGAAICYVLFALPSSIFSLLASTVDGFMAFGKYSNSYYLAQEFIFNTSIFGLGIDFFCFLALSSKFRQIVYRTFVCKKGKSVFTSFQEQTTQEEMSMSEAQEKYSGAEQSQHI